jgi:UDP-glucose 4-epimerase
MNVLITGGAGYIGSHAVRRFLAAGHGVVVLDNLDRGHRAAVPSAVPFEQIELARTDAVVDILRRHRIDAVCHFAALTYVGESVQQPLRYYENNVCGSLSLLKAMRTAGIGRLVFSSTAATYGEPAQMPIDETTPQEPINPYGFSKLFVERMLHDLAETDPAFAFTILRYFNVAGCAEDGSVGEDHDPETHIIPVILQTALGKRPKATIFGDDYPTPDGTCIRDYIHVEDLVDAHVVCAEAMKPGHRRIYNLGIGRGLSVRQIVDAAAAVTGKHIPVEVGPRREGDPPQLYTSPAKIQRELGWRARITDIGRIVETAWQWFASHPDGYEDAR